MSQYRSRFAAGERVEIRSLAEILATLDDRGELDSLPFMPEMLRFCGRSFQVVKTAHKSCDTVNKTGGRRMSKAVHLTGLRCDGSAHGGCEAACLLFWKDEWLKPAEGPHNRETPAPQDILDTTVLAAHATANELDDKSGATYVCQATRHYEATGPLPAWRLSQYWDDILSGNESAWEAKNDSILRHESARQGAGPQDHQRANRQNDQAPHTCHHSRWSLLHVPIQRRAAALSAPDSFFLAGDLAETGQGTRH